MDCPKFVVSNQKNESICIQWVTATVYRGHNFCDIFLGEHDLMWSQQTTYSIKIEIGVKVVVLIMEF